MLVLVVFNVMLDVHVVDVDAEVSYGVLNVAVTKQYLDSAQVAGRLINQRRFGAAHRVSYVFRYVQSDCANPLVDQSCILTSA